MKPSKKMLILLLMSWLLAPFGGYSEAHGEASFLPRDLGNGWALVEGPRTFTKKNLFEHIDGQAELFFKYGFQKCTSATFKDRENPEHQIDADVYEMGNTLQAFGIFSRLRTEDRPGGFGLDSALDENSALFYQGKYFVMLYATEEDRTILKQLATQISNKMPPPSSPPRELSFFPKDELRAGSIQYFSEGLLGLQFLKGGFRGTYLSGEKEYHLFLALFKNARDGQRALDAFRDYLGQKGKGTPRMTTESGLKTLRGESPYQGEIVVLQKGSYLLGGVGPQIGEKEESKLAELARNVK